MAIHFPNTPATYRNIPKTGTTSFRFWARDHIPSSIIMEDPERPYNMLHLSLDDIKNKWPDYGTTFTFVRNPYDRMVSIFHHVGQDAEERLKERLNGGTKNQYGVKKVELDAIPIETDVRIISVYRKGFDNWIRNIQDNAFDGSLMSLLNQKETQMRWLNHIVPDIVIKIEEVNDKFYLLQDLLQCGIPFPHVNKSQHNDYRQYYTPVTQKIVAELFKEDFETFGYNVNL
jgi:hypothetical protein